MTVPIFQFEVYDHTGQRVQLGVLPKSVTNRREAGIFAQGVLDQLGRKQMEQQYLTLIEVDGDNVFVPYATLSVAHGSVEPHFEVIHRPHASRLARYRNSDERRHR